MTDQYFSTNINAPRRTVTVAETASLNEDADLVIVNTTGLGAPPTITLPDARLVDGRQIVIKVPVATVGSGGQNVIVDGLGGQTIDGALTVTIAVDQTALTVKSNNANWEIVAQTNASTSCCPPSVVGPSLPLAQGAETVMSVAAGTCGLDEPLTGEVFNDPDAPPPVGLPTINSISVTAAVPPASATVDINLDTSTSDGAYVFVLTNDCGCCTIFRFSVAAA